MGIFSTYHTVKEWEDAVAKDGRIELYSVYYVVGKRVVDHTSGVVKIEGKNGEPIFKFVSWLNDGQCFRGKQKFPEYNIVF